MSAISNFDKIGRKRTAHFLPSFSNRSPSRTLTPLFAFVLQSPSFFQSPSFSNRRRSPIAAVLQSPSFFHKHFLIRFFNYSFVSDFHPHELLCDSDLLNCFLVILNFVQFMLWKFETE
ncbi:hypothetical protein QL285_094472 [Trifolium repens]|nr:hypothetical protein QL285_094472 [Trifolium repens]